MLLTGLSFICVGGKAARGRKTGDFIQVTSYKTVVSLFGAKR